MQDPSSHDGSGLIACHHCDALYRLRPIEDGARAKCARCGSVLLAPRRGASVTIVSLSLGSLILLVIAITFPFLGIEASGLSSKASVVDAIFAFADTSGLMAPLSIVVAALIVFLPALRLTALIYALAPLIAEKPPFRHAAVMFRIAMRLRPWAMAEIFMIGVAVALVKIAGMADVDFGPAFWTFGLVVVLMAAKDTVMCERSIWQSLIPSSRS